MGTDGLRILIWVLAAAALLGLGALEIITARPRVDQLTTEVGNRGDDRPGSWLEVLGIDEGDKR